MTKIFVGGFHHESDTINPITTGKDDIKVRRGNELLEEMREDALKGIISYLKKEGSSGFLLFNSFQRKS